MIAAQLAWTKGIAPVLTTPQLQRLLHGLRQDDPNLIQRDTCRIMGEGGQPVNPGAASVNYDKPACQGCAIGYAVMDHGATYGEVLNAFDLVTSKAINKLEVVNENRDGLSADADWVWCDDFISWFDENPRAEVFPKLAAWIEEELENRSRAAEAARDEEAFRQGEADASIVVVQTDLF